MLLPFHHVKACRWHLSVVSGLLSILVIIVSAIISGCGKRFNSNQLSSDEEEALYLLVG